MRRLTKVNGRGLVAAMEEEEVIAEAVQQDEAEAAAAEVAEAPIESNTDSLETDMIEVVEEEGESEEATAEVEEAVETAEALENIALAMESSVANGGMDKHSALALGIALDRMYASVGISGVKPMPALEQFGGASSRVSATKIAMEDVKEQVKKIWDAIVKHIMDAIAWIKDRYMKIFDAATKLKGRADALAKRADATEGSAKEKTFDNERLFAALHIGSDVRGVAAAQVLNEEAKNVFNNANYMTKLAEGFAQALEKGDPSQGTSNLEGLIPGGSVVGNPSSEGFPDVGEGYVLVRGKELPGGKAIVGKVVKDGTEFSKAASMLNGVSVGVNAFSPKRQAPGKASIGTLSTADCAKVAALVSEVSGHVSQYKSGLDKVSAAKSKIAAAAKKFASSQKGEGDAAMAHAKELRQIAAASAKLLDQPAASFHVYALGAGKALLGLVEESLKQYGAAE